MTDDKLLAAFFQENVRKQLNPFAKVHWGTVRDWRAKNRLKVMRDGEHGPLAAVWCEYRAPTSRAVKDFTGGTIAVPYLTHRVDAFAYADFDRMATAFAQVSKLYCHDERDDEQLILFADVECERQQAIVRALGLHQVSAKVSSFADIVGIYTNYNTGYKLRTADRYGLQRLKRFDFSEQVKSIIAGLRHIDAIFENHYSKYNAKGAWSALALRGYGGDERYIIKPAEMTRSWRLAHEADLDLTISDTPLMEAFPNVRKILDAIPGEKHRVRFMRLSGDGGALLRHTDQQDKDVGTRVGQIVRLHVPLVTSDDVTFTSWLIDGTEVHRYMRRGELWYLDIRKPHCAENAGSSDRIHLVIDVVVTDELLEEFTC